MKNKIIVPEEFIEKKIFFVRGKKVMLDKDLAFLYGVKTKVFKQAVRRNSKRFPNDFMFELSNTEFEILRSQIVTSSWGGTRILPLAFTEQGVAMLSSVLNSEKAIQANIQIMRIFTRIREMIISNKELRMKIENLEKKYDKRFQVVFDAIRQILETTKKEAITPQKKIGFVVKK